MQGSEISENETGSGPPALMVNAVAGTLLSSSGRKEFNDTRETDGHVRIN
jgi:hypothetical protein